MDFQLPDNMATWVFILVIAIRFFGPALSKLLFEKFPSMADKHFASVTNDKADIREFEQLKELELLRADLKSKDAAHAQAELVYNQQIEREKIYTDIIKQQFDFLHKLADNQLLQVEASIISEIMSLKASFEKLSTYIKGDKTDVDTDKT